jgi:hypothetical protein
MAKGGHGLPGLPCPTLLRPVSRPPLKRPYGCFKGGQRQSSTLLDTPCHTPLCPTKSVGQARRIHPQNSYNHEEELWLWLLVSLFFLKMGAYEILVHWEDGHQEIKMTGILKSRPVSVWACVAQDIQGRSRRPQGQGRKQGPGALWGPKKSPGGPRRVLRAQKKEEK